jgi:hypothetical protein
MTALQTRSWEASVPSLGDQNPEKPGIDWPAIVRTLLVQVLVLLALSVAFVRYVNWSSDAAFAEFISASKSSGMDPKHHPQPATPVHTVKGQKLCPPKA